MSSNYVWYTDLSAQFMERDYLLPGEILEDRVEAICNTAEKILKVPGFAAKFKGYLQKGWYSLSTPVWVNFGTQRGSPISCFGSQIDDCMESILYTQAEVGMMTKIGGGTSAYFGHLRPRGATITGNGESYGSVHFMRLFDNLINVVSQGKTRRGNFAAYLPIDHSDILEMLQIRTEGHPMQDISYGVTVPDYWMREMIAGDAAKRKVWAGVLNARLSTGFPYIVFSDNANNNTVDVYKDKSMKITNSNLCVTGDQLAVTAEGICTVLELYKTGKELTLFDGEKQVNAGRMELLEKQVPILEITTTSGRKHKVTDYHQIKTKNGKVAAKDLKVGDRICCQRNKGLFGGNHNPHLAFLEGLFQGDGCTSNGNTYIDLWENDFDLIPEIESIIKSVYTQQNWLSYEVSNQMGATSFFKSAVIPTFCKQTPSENGVKKVRLQSTKLAQLGFNKGVIPSWLWRADEETQASFLRGLFITDGTGRIGNSTGNPVQIALASMDKEFLRLVQIMLTNLGVMSSIHLLRKEGKTLLPDGKGGRKLYPTQNCWRLIVGSKPDALKIEDLTGFLSRKKVFIERRNYRDNRKKFDTVKSIEMVGVENVFCTKVNSPEHVWVCNGFITSNCSEIMLPSSFDESFVCTLSSMNITHYDDWKNSDAVETLVFFLDAVVTEFIEKNRDVQFMSRAVNFAERHRALGIGWIGWHTYLQKHMIAFESLEAKFLNTAIAQNVQEAAWKASQKAAGMYGEPHYLKGYGRRNTTLTAIAPTKSSSFILGQVSEGIEPQRTNYYIKDLAKGKYTIKNPQLERLLETKGQNTPEIWNSILRSNGSVQHLSFLDAHEKAVFKTFAEISPMDVVIQASQRQKYLDQSQSLNLMIHPSTPAKDVNALMIEAWHLGVKSLYYQIGVNAAQEFSRSILTCSSCES